VVRHLVGQHGQCGNGAQAQSAMKADAIRMPSPKQCTLSPVSTAQLPPGARDRAHEPRQPRDGGHGGAYARRVVVVAWRCVHRVVVFVPVVPELGLVEQKEENQPHQQRQKQVMGTGLALKRFGQQVHEGRGHQGTSGQAEHVLGVAGQCAKAQGCSHPHGANAGHQGSDDDCYQCHSVLSFIHKGRRPFLS
jgi:hypothetical protein